MELITKIKLLGEGKQFKEIIEGKYTYTELADKFNIYEDSIKQYLDCKQITINKCREQLEEVFEKPYNQIITTIEAQLDKYLLSIKNNIRHYKTSKDDKLINTLYKETLKYGRADQKLIAKGNLALYNYNMGLHFRAGVMLKEVVEGCKKENLKELIVYYTIQEAFVHLGEDIKKSIEAMKSIADLIDENITHDNLFNYYYFYGIILNRRRKRRDARKQFHLAFDYAVDEASRARALSNIALTYYEEKKYREALQWNELAWERDCDNGEIRSGILNNIANVYIQTDESSRASDYLEKAMEYFSEDFDISFKINVYDTYLDLNTENGDKLFEEILLLLQQNVVITENQQYLPSCVEKLYHRLIENKDWKNLDRLVYRLVDYCDQEGEKRPLNELKVVAMNIIIYLQKNGRGVLREKSNNGIVDCIND